LVHFANPCSLGATVN